MRLQILSKLLSAPLFSLAGINVQVVANVHRTRVHVGQNLVSCEEVKPFGH